MKKKSTLLLDVSRPGLLQSLRLLFLFFVVSIAGQKANAAIESSWDLRGDVLYLHMVEGESIDDFGDANTIAGIFQGTRIVITGKITSADILKIGAHPYGSYSSMDLSLADISSSDVRVKYGVKGVVVQKDGTLDENANYYNGGAYNPLSYAASPSADYQQGNRYENVIVVFSQSPYDPNATAYINVNDWKSDPTIQLANNIYINDPKGFITDQQLSDWSTEMGVPVVKYDANNPDVARNDTGVGDVIPTSGTFTVKDQGGSLAEQIATANAAGEYDYFVIKGGTYTAADIAALKNLTCAKNIIMDEAVLTDDAKAAAFEFNSDKIEYVVLPKDLENVNANWFNGCTSLKSAISYSSDGTSIKAYNKVAGELKGAINLVVAKNPDNVLATASSMTGVGYELTSLTELVISGLVNANDINKRQGGSMTNRPMEHFDLTNATLVGDDGITKNDDVLAYTGYLNGDGYAETIRNVDFPTNLESIPAECFELCHLLGDVYITRNINYIGEHAFYQNNGISKVEFEKRTAEDQPLSCGDGVFELCQNMKHIVIPEGFVNLGNNMFAQCSNLESLRLPNTLQVIGDGAFFMATSLHYLTIPASVETIGHNAFANSGITDLYLMAESVEDLPKIYSGGYGVYAADFGGTVASNDDSTFGFNSIYGDNNVPALNHFKDFLKMLASRGQVEDHPEMTEDDVDGLNTIQEILPYLTTSQIEQVYFNFNVAGDVARTFVKIHYPNSTEIDEFMNSNPWKDDEDIVNFVYSHLGTYSHNADGTQLREAERFRDSDRLDDANGFGPDKYGHYWPDRDHYDYALRMAYGNPAAEINNNDQWNEGGTEPSRIGWRQFALKESFSNQNDDEVYKKNFDDTWYTVCFPFDLTDEQLEGAFNPNFNICEFSGVAMEEKDTEQIDPKTGEPYVDDEGNVQKEKNLILLFTNIAKTYYRDMFGNYYDRVKDSEGNKLYYPATMEKAQNGETLITRTGDAPLTKESTGEGATIYESIRGVLAQAGHPYLIHPQKVEDINGGATQCVINHINYKFDYNEKKKAAGAEGATAEIIALYEEAKSNLQALFDSEAVTRTLSTIVEGEVESGSESTYNVINMASGKVYLEPVAGNITYTFKGSFESDNEVLIPDGAYFLATPIGVKYPKFYRETGSSERQSGYWQQYTAVIEPNDNAKEWEDQYVEVKPAGGSNSGAKSFSMAFGDFEILEATEIEEILAEAEEKHLPVEYMNVVININGQIVREGIDTAGLPKGIYIVNGKKYMVK